jgi:hypothetical protein
MPAPRFGETDEEVQNEAQKSILRVFHALILSDFFGASALPPDPVSIAKEATVCHNQPLEKWE